VSGSSPREPRAIAAPGRLPGAWAAGAHEAV